MKQGVLKSFINFIRNFFTILDAGKTKKPLAVWSSTLSLCIQQQTRGLTTNKGIKETVIKNSPGNHPLTGFQTNH
jgi:hypothetical protein